MHATRSRVRTIPITGLLLAAACAAGCAGHGQHTEAFKIQAQERMAQLKAATQWDLAQQQYLSGDVQKALKSIDQSIAMSGTVPKSHTLRGRILLELGRLEESIQSFDRALELDPKHAESHYFKGVVLERFSRAEEALASYKAAGEHDPSDPQYLIAAAEMLVQLGRLDEASALLAERESDFEHNAGIRQMLGHIAMMRGDTPVALLRFKEACTLDPDDPALLEDLVHAQLASGDKFEAEYGLRRLLREPSHTDRRDLHLVHAHTLAALDRPVEARDILERLIREGGGSADVPALIALGEVSLTLNDQRRLRAVAQQLAHAAPDRPESAIYLALWHRERGELDEAAASLGRAIEKNPTDPRPRLLQAFLFERMGKLDDARLTLQAALAARPDDAEALRALERLNATSLTPAVAEAETP